MIAEHFTITTRGARELTRRNVTTPVSSPKSNKVSLIVCSVGSRSQNAGGWQEQIRLRRFLSLTPASLPPLHGLEERTARSGTRTSLQSKRTDSDTDDESKIGEGFTDRVGTVRPPTPCSVKLRPPLERCTPWKDSMHCCLADYRTPSPIRSWSMYSCRNVLRVCSSPPLGGCSAPRYQPPPVTPSSLLPLLRSLGRKPPCTFRCCAGSPFPTSFPIKIGWCGCRG